MAARVLRQNLSTEEFDDLIKREILDSINKQFSEIVDLELIRSRLYNTDTSVGEIHDSALRIVGKGLDFVLKRKETRGSRGTSSIEIVWELAPKPEAGAEV